MPLRIERAWAMPSKNTFSITPIGAFVQAEMGEGLWIDPFSCGCRIAGITNDLNPDVDADYHLDALDFFALFDDDSVDGVLYDPPYSSRQVAECYHGVGREVTMETTQGSFWAKHKREMARIVKHGGKVLSFGWNSGGVGRKYGFEMTRILLVAHGGRTTTPYVPRNTRSLTRRLRLPCNLTVTRHEPAHNPNIPRMSACDRHEG